MITKLLLKIGAFPQWLRRVKQENGWLYGELWAFFAMMLGIVVNFFSFRSEAVYLVLAIGIPGLWILFQFFIGVRIAKNPILFAKATMLALPILAMVFADLLSVPAILFARDRLGPSGYAELYLLLAATLIRIPLHFIVKRTRFRGKTIVDIICLILAFALSVIMHALAITA
ncbi:MAG: hypothetical protein V1761_02595 [bacterium]